MLKLISKQTIFGSNILIIIKIYSHTDINTYINGVVLQKKKKNMQNYAQIGDIDHYSLHNIFIISVVT